MNAHVNNIPKTPMALYIKFYCQNYYNKSGAKRASLFEATRSWLALSDEEKLMFTEKLKQYRNDYKKKFADYLRNVVPYMKKKRHQNSNQIESEPGTAVISEDNTQRQNIEDSGNPFQYSDQPDCEASNDRTHNDTHEKQHDAGETQGPLLLDDDRVAEAAELSQVWTETRHQEAPELVEPVPPRVKTAEELYHIVHNSDGGARSWNTLPTQEKKRYHSSVLALKKNYIQKYKAFLESLPSEQLYEYYTKKVHY